MIICLLARLPACCFAGIPGFNICSRSPVQQRVLSGCLEIYLDTTIQNHERKKRRKVKHCSWQVPVRNDKHLQGHVNNHRSEMKRIVPEVWLMKRGRRKRNDDRQSQSSYNFFNGAVLRYAK